MVLVAAISVTGTLAYLYFIGNKSVCEFTIGNVSGSFALTGWDSADHKTTPGVAMTCDPTVTVNAGSEACYVFFEMDSLVADTTSGQTFEDLFSFGTGNVSELEGTDYVLEGHRVFYKALNTDPSNDQTVGLFNLDQVTPKPDVEPYPHSLNVNGAAIQQATFNSVGDAWLALTGNTKTILS